jgi:hypothetical protein
MQEKHLFEYAVIRIVPRVEREEFINAGVILYCAAQRFLGTVYQLDAARLTAFCSEPDMEELEQRLLAFTRVCAGKKESGPIGQMPIASRFRWLTATRSTVVQTSKVHPGFCTDAAAELEKLFVKLVKY